jgi:hypothetical protein
MSHAPAPAEQEPSGQNSIMDCRCLAMNGRSINRAGLISPERTDTKRVMLASRIKWLIAKN